MNRIVTVERCKFCTQHRWRTHDDAQLYQSLFQQLKSILSAKGYTIVQSIHYRFGSFEVTYWGVIIFSKLLSKRLPQVSQVVAALTQFTQKHDQGVRLKELAVETRAEQLLEIAEPKQLKEGSQNDWMTHPRRSSSALHIKILDKRDRQQNRSHRPATGARSGKNQQPEEEEDFKEWKSTTAKSSRSKSKMLSIWTTTPRGWMRPLSVKQEKSRKQLIYCVPGKRPCFDLKMTPLDVDRWAILSIRPYTSKRSEYL